MRRGTRGTGVLRPRRGFTLWEMTMVFAVMSVTALFVIPAWTGRNDPPPATGGDALVALLTSARRVAIDGRQLVQLHLDPRSGAYRVDTTGVAGTGLLAEGTIALDAFESFETDAVRVRYEFSPSGASFGDSLLVRGAGETRLLALDPWSGVVVTHAR